MKEAYITAIRWVDHCDGGMAVDISNATPGNDQASNGARERKGQFFAARRLCWPEPEALYGE